MSTLLLNLRNVPDDEAADVRAILDAHGIEFFETTPSRWGISAGAIWIVDTAATADAQRLMADYQRERRVRARATYGDAKRDGTAATLWTVVRDEPIRVLVAILSIAFVLGLLALPVLLMSNG
jgi:hypothetical protein